MIFPVRTRVCLRLNACVPQMISVRECLHSVQGMFILLGDVFA